MAMSDYKTNMQPCPKCGSKNTRPRGDRLECLDCKARTVRDPKPDNREEFTVNKTDGTAVIRGNIPENMSEKELVKHFKIDLSRWRIKQIRYKNSQGYRKDRQVQWDVKEGRVVYGHVRDSGKMLIVNLVGVEVLLEEKIAEIAARNEVELIKKEATSYAPKYKLIKRAKQKDGYLYEIMMPDLHLGRLVDSDETGYEASPDLFVRKAERAICELLEVPYPIERILFPVGNDFFNVNNTLNMTAHGTHQPEDPRWRRTYTLGKNMIIRAVETMTTIAPVDLLIIPGNHDTERVWYFGDTLVSWFHGNPNVTVDNRAKGKKEYRYGNTAWLFAHGYYEKENKVDALMSGMFPQLWAQTRYHEVHLGDKHHKKDVLVKTDEMSNGVMVRIFRSLADPSVWEFDKGFDSLRAAEGLLFDKERGLKAQFTAQA